MRRLEKYEVLEEIGRGGMAVVYRARDTTLERDVALKVMHPHLRDAGEALSRFAREARSVARLRHPNIMEIYDFSGQTSEESYIAAELLTGPTLKVLIEQVGQGLPAEIAACCAIEVARALAAAHQAGIVHRDVKPENVLIHERALKLTDFGIAQLVDAGSFTATGQVLGSPGHMAPEQVEAGECDARTDLFSLGTVLYYLAVGRLPFEGKNPHQVLRRLVEGDYVPPLRAKPSMGGRLSAIIERAMSRAPADRYQSAEEMEADLSAFVAELGIDAPAVELARFFDDPLRVTEELRERAVASLPELGEQAWGEGDLPRAMDYFNRTLALDEGNARVLSLLRRIGRHRSRRRMLLASGVFLSVFGLAGLAYGILRVGDAAVVQDGGSTHSQQDAAVLPPIASRPLVPDGGLAADGAGLPSSSPATQRSSKRNHKGAHRGGLRTVSVEPDPVRVSYAVDDGPMRPWGSASRLVKLRPGRHKFRFIGSQKCCKPKEIAMDVPAGPGTSVLRVKLDYRPARLYVQSSVPADVRVSGGSGRVAKGRARELFPVPMGAAEEVRQISVTAPGHASYTTEVRLRAGHIAELAVRLQSTGGT